jgi:glutamate-1-semialdehyde 2,1-aminomutase
MGGKSDEYSTERVRAQQRVAEEVLPGGVAGSGRFNPGLGYSLFLQRAQGSRIIDLDENEYIDFNMSHGSVLLGHGHPRIRQAVLEALETGVSSGYETTYTAELARKITEIIPCAEMVRLANSGTEGTMVALRLARAMTGRSRLLKFWGHFHGLHDYVMYNANSPQKGAFKTLVPPSQESGGIPRELDELVYVVPWNDAAAIEEVLKRHGSEIAAIMMEPINYDAGCIVADKSYIRLVRELATKYGIVLIFDEVLSAFRTGVSCAQGYYGVTPDLCVISKAVCNGLPLAVVAGRKNVLLQARPGGEVSHSGTCVGNLVSVKAALATLEVITGEGFYEHIYDLAGQLYPGLSDLFARYGVPARVQGLGARFGIYFGLTNEVRTFSDALKHDPAMAERFYRACAGRGVYFHNYGKLALGHHGFSAAHTTEDIAEALNRIEVAMQEFSGTKPS